MSKTAVTLLALVMGGACAPLWAQDLTIVNARIIGANATVIQSGSIVVHDGKITSVAAGLPAAPQGQMIDAHGMTALPGYIDAHKHIGIRSDVDRGPVTDEQMKAWLQDLLEAGYTTVLSAGGPAPADVVVKVADEIDHGQLSGPRIIPSGPLMLQGLTAQQAQQQIRQMAARGIKWTGEIGLTPVPGPSAQELQLLSTIVEEGRKDGVTVQVHAVSTAAMMGAVSAGVRHLVHLPNKDWVPVAQAQKLAATDTYILGTIGFGAPVFGVFASDNMPRFRDGRSWPNSIIGGDTLDGHPVGQEAGYTIVNARTIWDQGGVLGYCTDTEYEATAGLEHELKSYNVVFSMQDMVKLMGPNTAAYLGMSDQIGTLEPGKLADIVLLRGNPLEGYWNWLRPAVVIKGGKVLADRTGPVPPASCRQAEPDGAAGIVCGSS